MARKYIIRTSTVPSTLNHFCKGLFKELTSEGYVVSALSSSDKPLAEIEKREGIKTFAVPMERRISVLRDLRSLWMLLKIFRREKPTMVHSMTPKAGLLSMLAAKICKVPVRVHTFTGLLFSTATGLKRYLLIATDRITCACATHIVPEGQGVKRDLIEHRITKKPLTVLGNGNVRGIDPGYYNPWLPEVQSVASRIRREDVFTFIFVGRMVHDKGIDDLIPTFEKINNAYPNTRLLLVGALEQDLDPLRPETLKKISSHPAIQAVGYQADVRPWYIASDALVFPSYREGFPNVVIEAGAMGLPSIVTDINGSNEIIIDGKNGIIIPPKDVKALEVAMRSFVENRERAKEMGKRARPLVASRYEQSFVRQCLKDYYKEILGEKGIQ